MQQEDFLLPTKLIKRVCEQCSQWYRKQVATPGKVPAPSFDQEFLITLKMSALGHHYSLCHFLHLSDSKASTILIVRCRHPNNKVEIILGELFFMVVDWSVEIE